MKGFLLCLVVLCLTAIIQGKSLVYVQGKIVTESIYILSSSLAFVCMGHLLWERSWKRRKNWILSSSCVNYVDGRCSKFRKTRDNKINKTSNTAQRSVINNIHTEQIFKLSFTGLMFSSVIYGTSLCSRKWKKEKLKEVCDSNNESCSWSVREGPFKREVTSLWGVAIQRSASRSP